MAARAAPDPGEVSECELAPSYREREAAVHTEAWVRPTVTRSLAPSGRGGGSASPSSPRLLAVDRALSSPGLERLLRRWAPASVHAEAGRPLLSKAKGASLGGGGELWGPLHAWTPQSSDLGSRTVKGEEAACSYGTGR